MASSITETIRLCVIDEQTIYRELYQSILPAKGRIDLVELSSDMGTDKLREMIEGGQPDVLVYGIKRLDENVVAALEQIIAAHERLGIVLFLVYCDAQDIDLVKKLVARGRGIAVFLKQSLDMAEQIRNIIVAVNQRQVILDPALSGLLFKDGKNAQFLRQLTGREGEILGLLARGHTNSKIAASLFIDIKTVEHHINSMYGKLKNETDFNEKHPRVSAARLYLEATGELAPAKVGMLA